MVRDKFSRLVRRRRPVAFVFSGGGPLGAAQVGLLEALFTEGIRPDVVIGCSVGSINAVSIAAEPTLAGVQRLKHTWLRMRRDDFFPGGKIVSAWHAIRRGSHVFGNEGARRILETELPVDTFDELRIPAHVVAAELQTGEEKWFSSGPIVDVVLASTAMPGLLPPVTIHGISYIDGGVANNIPVSRAVELGARRIYVLNTSGVGHRRDLRRPHDFMLHGFVLARGHRYQTDLARARERAEVFVFPPVEAGHIAFTDLSHSRRLIEAGFEAGTAYLRSLRLQEDEETAADQGA